MSTYFSIASPFPIVVIGWSNFSVSGVFPHLVANGLKWLNCKM